MNEDDASLDGEKPAEPTSAVDSSTEDIAVPTHRRGSSYMRFGSFGPGFLHQPDSNAENTGEEPSRTPTHRRGSSSYLRFGSFGSSFIHRPDSHPDHAHEEPHLSSPDLWETDNGCHNATRLGYTMNPDCTGNGMHLVAGGIDNLATVASPTPRPMPARSGHSRAISFDAALLTTHLTNDNKDLEASIIRDRLHGYVRHHQANTMSAVPEN
jgi:hypothetical protein